MLARWLAVSGPKPKTTGRPGYTPKNSSCGCRSGRSGFLAEICLGSSAGSPWNLRYPPRFIGFQAPNRSFKTVISGVFPRRPPENLPWVSPGSHGTPRIREIRGFRISMLCKAVAARGCARPEPSEALLGGPAGSRRIFAWRGFPSIERFATIYRQLGPRIGRSVLFRNIIFAPCPATFGW